MTRGHRFRLPLKPLQCGNGVMKIMEQKEVINQGTFQIQGGDMVRGLITAKWEIRYRLKLLSPRWLVDIVIALVSTLQSLEPDKRMEAGSEWLLKELKIAGDSLALDL